MNMLQLHVDNAIFFRDECMFLMARKCLIKALSEINKLPDSEMKAMAKSRCFAAINKLRKQERNAA